MNELSIEMTVLLWSALLFVVHVGVAAVGADAKNGLGWAFGNRDTQPALPAWVERSRRAQANMAENLLPFACFVIIVQFLEESWLWTNILFIKKTLFFFLGKLFFNKMSIVHTFF